VSVPVRKNPAAMSFPSILLTKAASHLPPFGPVKLPGDQHAPAPFAHLRAPSRTVFYSFLPFFAAIASRKPTQGCASQNNLTPHLHDLRLPALPRVQGIQRFAASALSLFNPSTFQPFGATFWDENENLKNSILQHQHLAREILGRSSDDRPIFRNLLGRSPTQSDTLRHASTRFAQPSHAYEHC